MWNGIAMSSDGTKMAAVMNGGQIYVSSDSGASWNTINSVVSLGTNAFLAISKDGNIIAMSMNQGFLYISTPSTISIQTYNLPSMTYDGTISIGTSDEISPACPLITTPISIAPDQFCTIPSATVSALPINPAWQKVVPSVNKPESTGKWQFGSWGFCLDSPKYATCDAQFKGDICSSGFFKAMLGDTICGKYKKNGPYYCTKQPDYFSAISLAATTALSVIGIVVTICAIVLGKMFGDNYDGNTDAALNKKNKEKDAKLSQNGNSIEMVSSKDAHVL